jgi:hypothetical protein
VKLFIARTTIIPLGSRLFSCPELNFLEPSADMKSERLVGSYGKFSGDKVGQFVVPEPTDCRNEFSGIRKRIEMMTSRIIMRGPERVR